eukprot:m.98425 g.98425  ORF g.98425 m.98425 type:complete len:343 (-) comp16745_c0_seq6:167-1195(-)
MDISTEFPEAAVDSSLARMTPIKMFIILVCISLMFLLSGPFIIEGMLYVTDRIGLRWIRTHDTVINFEGFLIRVSDRAEYLVALGTLSGILSGIYFHITEFTVAIHEDDTVHLVLFHVIPSVVINCNILYFFIRATFMNPGKPKVAMTGSGDDAMRHCRLCCLPQPPRTHHCVTCGQCVNQQDHHCPFTANCVGYDNYPFFFGFVMWAWLLSVYAVWLCYHPFFHCKEIDGTDAAHQSLHCTEGHLKTPLFFLSTALAALVSVFFSFVLYLLFTGQTARSFLGDPSDETFSGALSADPLAAHRQRGAWHCAQLRLGPVSEWWRFVVPFSMQKRSHYADMTVS